MPFFKRSIGFQLSLIVLIVLPATAMQARAIRGGDQVNIRHELSQAEVQVKGEVSCRAENETADKACLLKIEDTYTSRSFNLVNAGAVMHYYAGGKKKVIVQGLLEGKNTISVKRAFPF